MKQTVYIKLDKSRCVDKEEVKISDICSVYCTNEHITNRIKALTVLKFPDKKSRRYVVSILKIIEIITSNIDGVDVFSEGEEDIVIEHSNRKGKTSFMQVLKICFVCFVTLVGGAFGIMAYNNDIGASELFLNIYSLVMGENYESMKVLETAYAVGLAIGIICFYGHFGNYRKGNDPTPLEVAMRLYEDDVDTTMIKQSDKEGKEIDVD